MPSFKFLEIKFCSQQGKLRGVKGSPLLMEITVPVRDEILFWSV